MTDVLDGLTTDEIVEGYHRAIRLIERLADASESETRVRIVRLLQSSNPKDPMPDIGAMVDRALDERDELRVRVSRAIERLDRLSGHGSATAAILKGEI